jgi:hypothetical protein
VTKSDFSEEAISGALLQKDDAGHTPATNCIRVKEVYGSRIENIGARWRNGGAGQVWTIKRFEKYLLGRKFSAYVDQGSLSLLKIAELNQQQAAARGVCVSAAIPVRSVRGSDRMYKKRTNMRDEDALSRVFGVRARRRPGGGRC